MTTLGGVIYSQSWDSPETNELREEVRRCFSFVWGQADSGWCYVGEGVKLGDADKPVCWWRAEGSTTVYRMIYGDLSIRDVDAADLPTCTPTTATSQPNQ